MLVLTKQEIIKQWKQGLSKETLAKKYRREYNQKIKIIRATPRHRLDGKMLTPYEALQYVEQCLWEEITKNCPDWGRGQKG